MFGDKNTYSPESSHFQSPSDCDKRPCPRELKFPQRGHTRHTGGPELWSGHVEDRQTETDRVTETGGRGGGGAAGLGGVGFPGAQTGARSLEISRRYPSA